VRGDGPGHVGDRSRSGAQGHGAVPRRTVLRPGCVGARSPVWGRPGGVDGHGLRPPDRTGAGDQGGQWWDGTGGAHRHGGGGDGP